MSDLDKIMLSGIEFFAHGGVTEGEKRTGQRYRAEVEMYLDLSVPARTDCLHDTVSYADVYAVVVETAHESSFDLIESLAGRTAERLLRRFPIQRVTVQIQKLLPPIDGVVAYAGVELTRERQESG